MRKRARYFLVLLLACGLLMGSACPTPPPETTPPAPPPTQEKPPPSPKSEAEELPTFPLTITDDLGRTVKINKLPQRIVSLAPSNTEILFALNLEDRIVGVSDYCDYPQAAKAKPRVAGYSTPDLERVVSLQPDLVLTAALHEKTVLPALEKLNLTVIMEYATSIDDVLRNINRIGMVNGKAKAAGRLVDDLNRRMGAVTSKTKGLTPEQRIRVLYVCWHNPIWTMGGKTFINDLIWKAGGVNIYADDFDKSRVVSLESVVSKNPQVIIISGMGTAGDAVYNGIIQEPRLKSVEAVVKSRVYKISDANLIERPGPRIVDGLEEVARLIHPEIFKTGK